MQRRNFLGLSLTLVGSSVFAAAAKPLESVIGGLFNANTGKDLSKLLVLNTKTNTIHFRNPLATKYKHFIAGKHAKVISVNNWNHEIGNLPTISTKKSEIPHTLIRQNQDLYLKTLP